MTIFLLDRRGKLSPELRGGNHANGRDEKVGDVTTKVKKNMGLEGRGRVGGARTAKVDYVFFSRECKKNGESSPR